MTQRFLKLHGQPRKQCMKKLRLLSLIFLVFIFECRKSDRLRAEDNNIIGKWTWVEYCLSIGGPMECYPVTPLFQTIEFKENGSFISKGSFLKDANRFEIVDRKTIKFQPALTSSGSILMGYFIKTAERELHIYPLYCIEGCEDVFKR